MTRMMNPTTIMIVRFVPEPSAVASGGGGGGTAMTVPMM